MKQETPAAAPPAPPPISISAQQLDNSPRAVYEAHTAKREVLSDQMVRLLNRRESIVAQLHDANVAPAEKAALEQHLAELNTRIVNMERTLNSADAEVAAAAGVPGAAVPDSRGEGGPNNDDEMIAMAIVFAGIALVIVAIAFARRLWKGTGKMVAQLPATFEARFTRMEESLDSLAIEMERVSEGQRFLSKVFAEEGPRALGAGAAQPIEVRAEAAERVRRG